MFEHRTILEPLQQRFQGFHSNWTEIPNIYPVHGAATAFYRSHNVLYTCGGYHLTLINIENDNHNDNIKRNFTVSNGQRQVLGDGW